MDSITSNNKPKTPTSNGFTQFEMVIVIILISILSAVAIQRMWSWRYEIERTFVETVKGNIKSALGLQTANLALKGKLNLLFTLAGSNPFSLLAQKPDKYLGILTDKQAENYPAGSWYFNDQQKALVYLVEHSEYFQTDLKGRPRIRLMIRLIYTDKNLNRRYEPGVDGIDGLDLVSLDNYRWKEAD